MINSLLQQLSLQQQTQHTNTSKGKKGSSSSSQPSGGDGDPPPPSDPSSSSLLSGLMGSNKKTMETISQLKKENLELKSAQQLRPQLLDLQHQLATLQNQLTEQQRYYEGEMEQLVEHNEALSHGITMMKGDSEERGEELKQQIIMIKQLTERNKYLESESRQLLIDLDEARYEIEQIRLSSVDPLAMDELQKKIEQLEGKEGTLSLLNSALNSLPHSSTRSLSLSPLCLSPSVSVSLSPSLSVSLCLCLSLCLSVQWKISTFRDKN
jgi:hypothetical protein